MCVQWWVPGACDGVLAGPELDPAAGVVDDDDDEDEVVALVVDVVPGLAEPPVDASATPAAPLPSPAATTAVMMSRRTRPDLLDPIRHPPSVRGPAKRARRRSASGLRSVPSACGAESGGTRAATLSRL
jgi:hypothetical protein